MQLRMRQRVGDERGATLVLMALIMVILLASAGLVVNVGLVRADRQRNKSVADVAVTAGMRALDLGGYVAPFRGACAAIDYLKTNHPELASLSLATGWTDGNGNSLPDPGNPCDSSGGDAYTNNYNRLCNWAGSPQPATARASFAWFTATSGDLDVKVRAGYAASDMTADNFRDDAFHTDTGAAGKYGCDQLAVIITEREDAGFGRVVGASELSSRIRSVGRVTIDTTNEAAVGLLLLEKSDCGAAEIADGNARAWVLGSGTQPGIIHSDSAGMTGCSAKAVLHGRNTLPGLQAGRSPDGTKPGIVTTTALLGPGAGNAIDADTNVVPQNTLPATTPAPTASGADVVGRIHVDTRYGAAVADLRTEAKSLFDRDDASPPAGWIMTGCTPSPEALAATTPVWVNCNSFGPSGPVTFQTTEILFTGNIKITGTGNALLLPNAEKVFVDGKAGGGGFGVSLSSGTTAAVPQAFTINTGTDTDCDARRANAPSKFARLVIGSGPIDTSTKLQMCQTFLFMMDGDRLYNWGENPSDNAFAGKIIVNGGGGLEWTAPNTVLTRPTASQLAASPFEDLALWTETSAHSGGSHTITGGGAMKLQGVFFAPNANAFKLAGGGDGNITSNAQFIVRKLTIAGGAKLTLTADPENSVLTPVVGGFKLVR